MRQRFFMRHQLASVALLLSVTMLASCTSFKAPVRPDYRGVDNVNTVDPTQLVGTWISTELNPYPGTKANSTPIEYRSDGTVKGTMTLEEEGMQALDDMKFELNGNWFLAMGVVYHQNITVKSLSDSALGTSISDLINRRPAISGQANIYEISDSRMVMVSSDGTAMEYVRQ